MKRLNLLFYITLITCLTLGSVSSKAQINLLNQNFDSSATFPPTGWQNNVIDDEGSDSPDGLSVWQQSTTGVALSSSDQNFSSGYSTTSGHSGDHTAAFNSWDNQYGTADLVTPAINVSTYPGGINTVSYWFLHPDEGGDFDDEVNVYVNTIPSATGGTLIGTSTGEYDSWTQFIDTIPNTYSGNVYIIFEAVSDYETDMYIDDVSVDHIGCTGTPSAGTITNAALAGPVCSGTTVTLSVTDPNTALGVHGFWQQSASATGPWVGVVGGAGASTLNYTTAALPGPIYYRYADSCTYTQQGIASNVYYVPVNLTTAVTGQPLSAAVCTGNDTSYTVVAVGTALSYQWQVNTGSGFTDITTGGGVYSNFTTPTLNITGATTGMDGYQYQVNITGTCGMQSSNSAALTVGAPPAVTTQPHDSLICATGTATFSIAATGIVLTYHWQVNSGSGFVNLGNGGGYSGVNGPVLTISNASPIMDGYQYRAVVNGACNPATSGVATLHINGLPTIVTQPTTTTTCNTSNASFTVAATGAGLTYRWQVKSTGNFTNITAATSGGAYSGYNTTTLHITGATLAMNGNRYRVIISGTCSPLDTSVTDTLKVNPLPVATITSQSSIIICPSDSVTFMGNATPGFTYQWYYDSVAVAGVTRDTFRAHLAGGYYLAITNNVGCTSYSASDTVIYLPAPVSTIAANGPLGFCQGSSVILTGNTNPGVTYAWKLNGNYISNANTPTDTASISGSYALYQNNGTCGTLSAPLVVTASAIPLVGITTTGAATFCQGQDIVLATTSRTGYTYQWSLNGTPLPTGTSSTYTANAAGSYSVQVFSGPGCSATSSYFPVTALPSPIATATPVNNTAYCPGGSAVINANALPNVSYQWYLNNAPILGAVYPAYAATIAGNYTVSIGGSNGCVSTSNPVTITALPAVTATIASNKPDTLCEPDSLILSTPLTNGLTYSWYNNNSLLSETTNKLVVHNAGSYNVVVANAGCSATSAVVTVAQSTTPTGAIAYSAPGSICGNTPAYLQAPGASNYSYQWYQNGFPLSNAYNQIYLAATPGSYTVSISAPLGCSYTPAAVNVSIGTIPAPAIQQVASQLCATDPTFAAYQWNFNNAPAHGQTSSCINITQVGGYSVTVTNATGCSATSDVYNITNLSAATVVNNSNIRLYPNPTSSVINIDAPAPVNISVTGIDGKVLLHADKATTINIGNLASGMYMIAVYDQENNLLKTEKVVKE